MMYTLFNYELDDDGIATFTVNRPEQLNAMNDDAWRELGAFMDDVEQTPEIRAVILTGAGEKAFIAGADLNLSLIHIWGLRGSVEYIGFRLRIQLIFIIVDMLAWYGLAYLLPQVPAWQRFMFLSCILIAFWLQIY